MGRAHEVRAASMAKTAAIKSKVNAKHGTAIYVAAKSGVPDPELNQTLKKAIEKAKKENVPADVIKRAIEKAKGSSTEAYNFIRYEGFGPNNSLIIVDCLSDNVNRTYTAVRTAFLKNGCKLGVNGSVSHMFDNFALFTYEGLNDEETLDVLIEADCEVTDVVLEEGLTTVYAPSNEYGKIRDALSAAMPDVKFLEDETTWIPNTYVTLTDADDIRHFKKLKETLDDLEDVQDIYHNIEGLTYDEE